MIDYGKLQPGVYLQHGDSIKSLEMLRSEIFQLGEDGAPSGVDELAARVAWVFIALETRKQKILEVPAAWMAGEDELDVPPLQFGMREFLPRIDEALQLYKRCYLHKTRNGSGQVIRVRWLDPATITPNIDSVDTAEDVQEYIRKVSGQPDKHIPAENILDFTIKGQREVHAAPSAATATSLAAQIMHGMGTAQDSIFDNNAIPPILINVPMSTTNEDKGRLEALFKRLFQPKRRGSKEQRLVAVRGEAVQVQQVELDFSKLMMTELGAENIKTILKSHGVPLALAYNDDSANRSTSEEATRNFISALGARAEFIAEVINADPDFEAMGFSWLPAPGEHWSQKRDEAQASLAFNRYTVGGLHPQAALYLLGITKEQFPDDMRGMLFAPVASRAGPVTDGEAESDQAREEREPEGAGEKWALSEGFRKDLDKWRRKALKRLAAGKSAAIDFHSEHIPSSLNAAIGSYLQGADSPDRVRLAFADAQRWQGYP